MILGIDFGRKKIGFAVLEDKSDIISPLKTFCYKKSEEAHNELNNLIKQYRISAIVVGKPPTNSILKATERFINSINPSIDTFWIDETLTSKAAKDEIKTNKMYNPQLSTKKTRENIDALSACEILEEWLTLKKLKNNNEIYQ